MTSPHQLSPSISSPLKQDDTLSEYSIANLDAFVSTVYLPHIRLRKRSWRVDERIARQHLSSTFGDKQLAVIRRLEVEDGVDGRAAGGLAPATCIRMRAVFKTICSRA